MEKFQKPKEKKPTGHKKQTRKYIRLGILAILIVLLAVMPMLASRSKVVEGNQASILSATVENKTINTQIIGGGQLSSAGSLNVRIPENVKLTQYLVGNGDTVLEGDAIAKVDKVSVMTAITEVQETLDYLAEEIVAASDDTASTSIKALAGGTVKVIYAKEGESVQDVMLDHGALAVLSLDDTMAVKIERESALDVGDTVCVTFSDGTEVNGRVKTNLEGVLTITMDDDDYSVGSKVTVTTEDGDCLGTGELYIFSAWSATAYSGYISDILVEENDTVAIGRSLFTLEDTGNSAQFQRLIDQRQEYEELMQELFTMYRTESITAPCDGIVTGVDEDGAFLLADHGDGWFLNLLSFFDKEDEGFIAYAAQVTEIADQGITMLINPKVSYIADMTALSRAPVNTAAMTKKWHYEGDTTTYIQNADGLFHKAGPAEAGDFLLAVGDKEQVYWFVILDGSTDGTVELMAAAHSGANLILLSDEDSSDEDTPSDNPSGEDPSGDGTSGDGTSGDGTSGDGTSGDDPSGEDPSGDGTSGDDPSGEDPSGDGTSGDNTSGDGTSGDNTSGEDPSGDNTSGEDPSGDGTSGDNTSDENTSGNDIPSDDVDAGAEDDITEETTTYTGYVAQVVEIKDGWMKVKQTLYSYTIADLSDLPKASTSTSDMTVEKEYTSELIKSNELAVGDIFLIVVNNKGAVKLISKETIQESQTSPGQQGGSTGAGTPSGGGTTSRGGGGMIGGGTAQIFETYSLDKLTVASITSQEHMTISITVDELDITKIYIGQAAVVSVDALGGERFDAEITQISNSGENDGGNSKFTVELTLGKRGEMLPGMYSSAFIQLYSTTDVPCIPVAALSKEGNDTIVYTSYDAEKGILGDPVAVTIGVSDGENVQIVSGMNLNDTCYYEYYDTYLDSDTPQQQVSNFNIGRMLDGR